jgi:putative Ca2+/H+ antiporter (TMEM165/GDT1 family)
MSAFLTVFFSIFLAELGDKTQLATVLFAAEDGRPKSLVFAGASLALITSTGLAVLLGAMAERYLTMAPLKLIAGLGFVVIGVLMIAEHFRAA